MKIDRAYFFASLSSPDKLMTVDNRREALLTLQLPFPYVNVTTNLPITVPVDALAPDGAKQSACTKRLKYNLFKSFGFADDLIMAT